jgi:tRNA U54 and U55 pseudouridine synthase Pus10
VVYRYGGNDNTVIGRGGKVKMDINTIQQKHKSIDDKICSICAALVGSEGSSEAYTSTAEKLKELTVTSRGVRDKLHELIDALEKGSTLSIDICRKELHWVLVDYRVFYENSENFK